MHKLKTSSYINFLSSSNELLYSKSGSSFSTPIAAGVAATIMSENPDIKFNYESMRKKLIELSVENIVGNLWGYNDNNRFLNNGKRSVVKGASCDDPSGQNHCQNGCCTRFGVCVENNTRFNGENLCDIEYGCDVAYGQCFSSRCDSKYSKRKCSENECCTKEGYCTSLDYCFIEEGCVSEFSNICLSKDLKNIDQYDEKYHNIIYEYNCEEELKPFDNCGISSISWDFIKISNDEHAISECERYKKLNCKE